MKEQASIISPGVDDDELLLYEINQEEKVRLLAIHLLWSSLVFLIALLA